MTAGFTHIKSRTITAIFFHREHEEIRWIWEYIVTARAVMVLLMVVGDFKGTVFFSFLTARPMFPTVKVPLAVRELSRELVPMSPKCTTHFIDSHIFARCHPICIFLSFTQNVTLWIHDHTDIVVTLNNKSIHFRRFGNPCQTHCCFHVSAHKWHLLATQVHFALMKPGHGLESCTSCASERY